MITEYRDAGMGDLVPKPIEIGVLFAAIERALSFEETADEARLAS